MADRSSISWADIINPDDSLDKLFEMLAKVETEYSKLSSSVISNSAEMKKAMQGLSSAQGGLLNVSGLTRQAQDAKAVLNELQNGIKALAQAKAAASNLTSDFLGESNSVNTLTKALRDNINAFNNLNLAEKNSAMSSGEILDKISSLRMQIDLTTRAAKTFATEVVNEDRSLAKMQKTILKLTETERKLYQATIAREEASKKAMKLEEAEAKVAYYASKKKETSLEGMIATYNRNILLIRQMSQEERKLAEGTGNLIHQTKELATAIRLQEEAVGNYGRSVGNYQKVWSGFNYSVAQIVRELPNAALRLETFFLAISNNIATFYDEWKVMSNSIDSSIKGWERAKIKLKTLGSALFSLNTFLMIAVTVLTKYGAEWTRTVKDWITGESALKGLTKAQVKFAEGFKDVSTSLGSNLYNFYKLKNEWNALKNDMDKISWIDQNEEAFAQLGIRIRDAADATDLFTKSQENMLQVLKDRAMFEASQKYAKEESDKWAKAVVENEAARQKALAESPGWFMATLGDPIYRFFAPGRKDYTSRNLGYIPAEMRKDALSAMYEKAVKEYGYENYVKLRQARGENVEAYNIFTLQQFAREESDKFQVVFNDYFDTVRKDIDIAKKEAEDMKGALELEAKMADKVRQNRIKIAEDYFEVENLFGHYVYKSGSALAGKFADFKNVDEMLDWYDKIVTAKKGEKMTKFSDFYGTTEYQQFLFSDLKKKTPGAGRKGPDGMDFDAWYARVSEAYRHKEAEAEAKADKDDWERKIKLIDERYEHERMKMRQLRKEADDILSGKKLVKGGVTAERREKLQSFIGSYAGLESDLDKANVREVQDVINKRMLKELEHEKAIIDIRLKGTEKESDAELSLQQQRLEMEKQIAIIRNRLLPESEKVPEGSILSGYALQQKQLTSSQTLNAFGAYQKDYESSRAMDKLRLQNQRKMFGFNQRQQDIYDIQTQKELLEYEKQRLQIELQYTEDVEKRQRLETQIADLFDKYQALDLQEQDKTGVKGLLGSISERGVGGGILDMLGMKDDTAKAVGSSFDIIKDNISSLIDSYVQLAEAAVKAQEKQVSAAQKVVDAELEASKQGYANRVASAQEDLKLEKQKLKEQKKERDRALKVQRAMDSAEAASSLTVAIAQLWKSCIGTAGFFGVPMATALTAVMLGSFVASRVKASKAARMQDEEYGEGGLEFLEGGSHASGNDIDLHTRNSEGKNMRAEGGEAMAIINKRNTRKYKKVLPDVIDSLNKGVFEDKYLNAFSQGAQLHAQILAMPTYPQTDLSGLESKLDKLVKQGENKVVSLPNGNTIEYFGNVKRTIKKND